MLEKTGVTQNIFHSTLIQLHDELTRVQRAIQPKFDKLQVYNELPAVCILLIIYFINNLI